MGVSRRTRRRELKKNLFATAIILIFALAVFSINSIGRFIAEKIIVPVAQFAGVTESSVTDTVTTPQLTLYLVSTGSFGKEKNANEAAAATVERGGGGYVFKNESTYNVIFGVYSKSDVAQTEAQQLADAFTPSVITVSLDGIKIKITGQKAQLEAVQGASELLYKIAHTLESTSNLAQDISPQDAEAELNALKTSVSLHKSALKGLNSANESIVSMQEMLSLAEELLEELPSSNQDTFLNELKYSAAKYVCEYYGFYNSLE
jgi:hypothetical protein